MRGDKIKRAYGLYAWMATKDLACLDLVRKVMPSIIAYKNTNEYHKTGISSVAPQEKYEKKKEKNESIFPKYKLDGHVL